MKKQKFNINEIFPWFKDRVFIIAEIGINHEGSFNKCMELILKAKEAGADAVKLQSMQASENYCRGSDSYSVFESSKLSKIETKKIFKFCHRENINIFSTFGDLKSMEYFLKLNPFAFKVSSGLLNHFPLLSELLKLPQPLLISTGLANNEDLKILKKMITSSKKKNISILHCISSYPTKKEFVNLDYIKYLENYFKLPIGYSDHTQSINIPALSVMAGAVIIEKHFTIDSSANGYDHKISLNPLKFERMVKSIRNYEKLLLDKDFTNLKKKNRFRYARCIVAKKNLKKNNYISKDCLAIKRPNIETLDSIEPIEINKIIGRKIRKDILYDTPLKKSDLK